MLDETRKTDVVIAGGSFAGLALAVALSKLAGGDLKIGVVSPSVPALTADAATAGDRRGSALSRGSLHLLDHLGVWETLRPHAQPVAAISITDSRLDDAIRAPALRYELEIEPLPAMVIVENFRLGAVLHEAARAAVGVTLIGGRSADGMASDANSAQVTLDDGSTLGAHLVVAADGGRSRLRQAVGISTIGWPYEQSGIVTVVEPEEDHKGCAVQHFLPAGPFALLPMTGNRICVTWTEGAAEARRIMGLDSDAFRHEVVRRFGYSLGAIKVLSPPQSWPLELALARRLIAPRLALVGDAAHKLHPIAGQGLNLGLRDVAALAECVIDAARLGLDVGHADVLERFERWRRFDNLTSAAGFDALNRLFSNENTLARSARGAALGLVDRLPGVKAWFVDEAAGARGDVPRLMRHGVA